METEAVKKLGQNIKAEIFNNGYKSIELFAHVHNIHKGTLSKILNGKVDPKYSTLLKIAKALQLPDSFFF